MRFLKFLYERRNNQEKNVSLVKIIFSFYTPRVIIFKVPKMQKAAVFQTVLLPANYSQSGFNI